MYKFFYKMILFSIIVISATLLYQKHTYAYHTLIHINPLPHTQELIAQDSYSEADEYLAYFMQFDYVKNSKQAQDLYHKIEQKRSSLTYKSKKVLEGIRTGTSDELSGQLGAIGSDFFLIGDLRDLWIQGKHYFKNEEVDNVILALSGIGIVASASTFVTLGSTSTAKSGISILKMAQKGKYIPTWMSKYLLRQAKQIKKTKNIKALKPLLKNIDDIYKQVGLKNTLKLLSSTKDLNTLKSMSKLTKRYGKNSSLLLKLSKGKILKHADTFKQFDKNTLRLASTYADSGYKSLLKNGEKNFLKSVKRIKSYAKVGYKGEIWKVFIWLLKNISDTILIIMISISTLLLLPWKRFLRR